MVGYIDPYEQIVIENTTVQYDTVAVMNYASLTIRNSNFTVNAVLVTMDNSNLLVNNSDFYINGISFFDGDSSILLKDDLTFCCDVITSENTVLEIDSAFVNVPMNFIGQYKIIGMNDSQFLITNSNIEFGNGKWGGGFLNNSSFHQNNNTFQNTIGIAMTLNIANESQLFIDNCEGGMELIIADSCNVNISDSNTFILWFDFPNNSISDFTFPPPNSSVPGASNITNFSFSNSTPGISGINYFVNIENSDTIFWGLMPDQGSDVTINNSHILACGFKFEESSVNTVSGFINDSLYVSYTAQLSDRSFNLNNTYIGTWNFYPAATAELTIISSIFGEALAFNDAILTVMNSACDGSGGYFGSYNNSTVYVDNSILQIPLSSNILIDDNSEMVISNSDIIGTSMVNTNSFLIISNTTYDNLPIVNDNAYFLEVYLDSLENANIDSIIAVTGTINDINGPQNNDQITRYRLEYSDTDSLNFSLIIDTLYTQSIQNDLICNWNTDGIDPADYLLWLITYVNEDSVITTIRQITLNNLSSLEQNIVSPPEYKLYQNYPNPFNSFTTIKFTTKNIVKNTEMIIYNLKGQKVKTFSNLQINNSTNQQIVWDARDENNQPVSSGIYFFRLKSGKEFSETKRMLFLK